MASLVGPTRYATSIWRHVATGFRHHQVATWIGLVVLVLAALVWSPFSASGNWITVLIVVAVVAVGVEALRRASLAEDEARRAEEIAAGALMADTDEAMVAVAADSTDAGRGLGDDLIPGIGRRRQWGRE